MRETERENSRRLPQHIRDYVDRLAAITLPLAIILFGSRARGEERRTSDYDLLVIADDLPRDYWQRVDLLWQERPLDVEIVGLTPSEIRTHLGRGLILDALLYGQTLYGNATEFQELARKYISERNLVRSSAGYFHPK